METRTTHAESLLSPVGQTRAGCLCDPPPPHSTKFQFFASWQCHQGSSECLFNCLVWYICLRLSTDSPPSKGPQEDESRALSDPPDSPCVATSALVHRASTPSAASHSTPSLLTMSQGQVLHSDHSNCQLGSWVLRIWSSEHSRRLQNNTC